MEREGWQIKLIAALVAILVAIFVVWPLWKVISSASIPSILRFFNTPYFVRPFVNSIVLGTAVAFCGTAIGFFLAYASERAHGERR